MDISPVETNGRLTRHRVREGLQEMILNGQQRPGSKLVQLELAKKFGVAQGVVREALLELQAYGLVETVDNRGVYVSDLDARLLVEAFGIREVHEGLAARLCCDTMMPGDVRRLRDRVQQIYVAAQDGRLDEMAKLDREFHQELMHLSGHRILARLSENYWILGKVVRFDRNADDVRREHLNLLDAIEQRKPEEAERVAREHIAIARRMLEDRIRSGSFMPHWVRGT